ncbi:hypothetical protein [Dictyobacter kobayashii]|uniref:Uncharacterized protein n=1 Tax=Dictyobacter kobayashii TaxID=2014872 RepID=A0A402AVI6_9CHLR|nr:hypothetical protein [Dictyobacter kobayashii]GCE23126.1 hypothetical protein KDK_69260 [Dictyobacter kobayashii]
MPTIPEYMRKAVEVFNIGDDDDWRLDKQINELSSHWGGWDVPTLQKILAQQEVSHDDQLIALLAIGFAGQPESFLIFCNRIYKAQGG